ncbi:hypothetical protein C8R45DRAFT_937065 [Mycena sanguinolenta]|nr:hypothetical protein C8R45DRAFT_937065 [Mycena sanguinolenta]
MSRHPTTTYSTRHEGAGQRNPVPLDDRRVAFDLEVRERITGYKHISIEALVPSLECDVITVRLHDRYCTMPSSVKCQELYCKRMFLVCFLVSVILKSGPPEELWLSDIEYFVTAAKIEAREKKTSCSQYRLVEWGTRHDSRAYMLPLSSGPGLTEGVQALLQPKACYFWNNILTSSTDLGDTDKTHDFGLNEDDNASAGRALGRPAMTSSRHQKGASA